jgi:acyl-CoA synthetase (AMP-forming)/AMP-acid ligase II
LAFEAGERLGSEVTQGYGMTGVSSVAHLAPPFNSGPGPLGAMAPNTEPRIVDPGTPVELGEDKNGEIVDLGPLVIVCYRNNKVASDAMLDTDGWLHAGDVALSTETDTSASSTGSRSSPSTRASRLPPDGADVVPLTHLVIADAVVVAVPDDEFGEMLCCAPPRPRRGLSCVDGHIAHCKQIRKVVITCRHLTA